jgi:4-amino-4-deoxy-L-arabinose transferase-like glycosyltransferase
VSQLYRIFGVHAEVALGLNVVLSSTTVVLMYRVGGRMFGRTGARIAGWSFAILPRPDLPDRALHDRDDVHLHARRVPRLGALPAGATIWAAALLGLAAGLAALTKGDGLLLIGIRLAIWWGRMSWPAWWRRTAIFVVAMFLTIAPWTIRNQTVMHTFIPISINASTTLWSGHNPKANGGPVYHSVVSHDRSRTKQELAKAKVERKEAIDRALNNPLRELGLIPRKLIALNQGDANALSIFLDAQGGRNVTLSQGIIWGIPGDALGYFLVLLTLGSVVLFGIRRLWRLHPGMQGVLAYLGSSLVLHGFLYYGQ